VWLVVGVLLAVFAVDGVWEPVVVALGGVVEVAEAAFWFRWSRRRRPAVGAEALIGRMAVVTAPCRPVGQVRVAGELWRARCDDGADEGDEVRIEAIDGLTLVVTGG
jgi:membrane protein implicated in regulation of membrane protease activity